MMAVHRVDRRWGRLWALTVLLAAIVLLALACLPSGCRSVGFWLAVFALPGCLGVVISYSHRDVQAFCIGAIFPATSPLINFADSLFAIDAGFVGVRAPTFAQIFSYITGNGLDRLAMCIGVWGASLFSGCMAVVVYRWFGVTIVLTGCHQEETSSHE